MAPDHAGTLTDVIANVTRGSIVAEAYRVRRLMSIVSHVPPLVAMSSASSPHTSGPPAAPAPTAPATPHRADRPAGRVVLDMSISLDGYVSAPDGEDGGLHDWYFAPSAEDRRVIDELLGSIGAMVLGRRMLGDPAAAFDTPYKVPHFVLTHTPYPTVTRDGVDFHFVPGGIEHVIARAREAAGDRVVCVAGGAATARAALAAGLVDELHLSVVSRLLGGGLRLFDGGSPLSLERTQVIASAGVTHLRYRVAH